MNTTIRLITGIAMSLLSILLIIFAIFFNEAGVDYVAVLTGSFFLLIGVFIIFNKKEDEVEQIKK